MLGLIRHAHVRNAVLADASAGSSANADSAANPVAKTPPLIVDPAKLRPVSRLGGTIFARVTEGFEIPRPSWREWEARVRKMMERNRKEKKGD